MSLTLYPSKSLADLGFKQCCSLLSLSNIYVSNDHIFYNLAFNIHCIAYRIWLGEIPLYNCPLLSYPCSFGDEGFPSPESLVLALGGVHVCNLCGATCPSFWTVGSK